MREFTWNVRVYYEDTDAGGMVYHGNYLRYLERARTEWLRRLGLEQRHLRDTEGIIFVVREMRIRYRLPARIDDMLQVNSRITAAAGARIEFEQAIHNDRDEAICEATVEVACLDAQSLKPRRLPATVESELSDVN